MKNREIADIFFEIADLLEMDNVSFRPYAYRKAAAALNSLEENIEEIYRKEDVKGLEKIPGVGKSIALLIKEYLDKGKVRYYQELKKKTPVDLDSLTRIEGMGPKTIKILYRDLGIKNIKELKSAAQGGKIASLFGFGSKKEKSLLEGAKFLEKSKGRFLLGDILPRARDLESKINLLPEVKKTSMAGSLRRKKETIGDIDFLIAAKDSKRLSESLLSFPEIVKVIGKGKTKLSVKMKDGFNVDFRIVNPQSYGAALQYFTGSKEHNIHLRKTAAKMGLKINEYGVFKGKKKIGGETEEEIYNSLGIKIMPPETREDTGEIEASFSGQMPKLVNLHDIKGDLHCHSDWSGGENTIEEMAQKAMELGYGYIGISDHTKFLRIENGLDEKGLAKQRKSIDKVNQIFKKKNLDFKILQGCEANILKDGSLDIRDESLAKLDFVIAGIHSHFKINEKEMTERIEKAMRNPNVNIISHPTGRILEKREEYKVDFQKMLRMVEETGTILEINAYPRRLDLSDVKIRKAKEEKVKMVINTDAHHRTHMDFMELGVSQARRGWAEKKDIINSQSLLNLLKSFKKSVK